MLPAAAVAAALAALAIAPGPGPWAAPPGLALPLASADPADVGRWSGPFDGEVPAVSLAILPTGEALYWAGADARHIVTIGALVEVPGKALARVLDLSGPAPVVRVPTPEDGGGEDLFCAGHAFLADGRLLVAGGTRYAPLAASGGIHLYGTDQAVAFDPAARAFAPEADMAFWRWYPTLVPLHDGSVLAVGGTADAYQGPNVRHPERFDPAMGRWASLGPAAENLLPLYPHALEVPTGPFAGHVAYVPGGCTSCTTDDLPSWHQVQTLDLATAQWTAHPGALQVAHDYSASVLLPLVGPDYASRVLTIGGGYDGHAAFYGAAASPLASVADFAADPPTVQAAAPMRAPRWFPQGVLLPTGEVLAVGGALTGHKESRFNPGVLSAEAFDPEALDPDTGRRGAWRALAAMALPRAYHGTAALLPDGRVLVGGHVSAGALAPALFGAYDPTFEVFEPPYLFRGPRPVIGAAPASAAPGGVLDVATPDAARVTGAALMRPGATTHGVDAMQRLVELPVVSAQPGGVRLAVPGDARLVPPGPWMLFLLQDHGQGPVPSVAHWLRLGG